MGSNSDQSPAPEWKKYFCWIPQTLGGVKDGDEYFLENIEYSDTDPVVWRGQCDKNREMAKKLEEMKNLDKKSPTHKASFTVGSSGEYLTSDGPGHILTWDAKDVVLKDTGEGDIKIALAKDDE